MNKDDIKKRSMGIMARIQAATARHDPSYKLKKRGFLNAHDMRKLIPSRESLMDDVKLEIHGGCMLSDSEKAYCTNDIVNLASILKHTKG